MNLLSQHLRHIPKFLHGFGRNYARAAKDKFSIEWVRPEKISCIVPEKSGDLGLDFKIHPKDPCKPYENIQELKDADELVQKLFSLEFNSLKQRAELAKDRALLTVKRHESDVGSHECHLAMMTTEIHHMQDIIKTHPRNKKLKVQLKEKIEKRKKYLKRLRMWDYKRFEWVLEKLNLIYKPPPETYITVTRKESIRKLAAMHCKKIKQERLDSYKAELKAKQKNFYLEKAKKLAFIREEEIACGLTPTVNEEDIENARKTSEALNRSPSSEELSS